MYNSTFTRFRQNKIFRNLNSEVTLCLSKFIQPIFVDENLSEQKPFEPIAGMKIDCESSIIKTIESDIVQGIQSFILFCIATEKMNQEAFTCQMIAKIKQNFGSEILLIADVCLCNETKDNHCGYISGKSGFIDNATTVEVLANRALSYAQAGCDCIAPSDMRDGRIASIRQILNKNGFDYISIISYSAKFASNYYGAFREIYNSKIDENSPLSDRKTYQIDLRNGSDAMVSSMRDEAEGCDMLMVKPATKYLDIIKELSLQTHLQVSAFHVASECVALELLAKNGYATIENLYFEDWCAINRAGASVIISYKAREAKRIIAIGY
jgi:porphobilinogen synthase